MANGDTGQTAVADDWVYTPPPKKAPGKAAPAAEDEWEYTPPPAAQAPPKKYLPGRGFGMEVAKGMGFDAEKVASAEDAGGMWGGAKELGGQALSGLGGFANRVLHDPFNLADPIHGMASSLERGVKERSPGQVLGATANILGGAESTEGAAIPARAAKTVTGITEPVGESLLARSAKLGNKLLQPTNKQFSYGANPGAALRDEGILGTNMKSIANKLGQAKRDVGAQIGAELSKPEVAAQVRDVRPAIEGPINNAIQEAVKSGDGKLIERLNDIKRQLTKEHQLSEEGELEVIGEKNLNLPPADVRKLKTQVGDATKWKGESFDPHKEQINNVRQQIYSNLRGITEETAPAVKPLNQRYQNVSEAVKSAAKRASGEERGKWLSRGDLLTAGTAELIGLASGRTGGGLAGLGILGAKKLAESPLGRTARIRAYSGLGRILGAK